MFSKAKPWCKLVSEKLNDFRELYLNFRYKGIIGVSVVFFAIAIMLFIERSGISFKYRKVALDLMPQDKIVTKIDAGKNLKKDTLVLFNSENETSMGAYKQYMLVLSDMKIGYDIVDVGKFMPPDFDKYEAVILLFGNLQFIEEDIFELIDWVERGGNVLFACTIERNVYSSPFEQRLAIMESSYYNTLVDGLYVKEGFMIGGGRGFKLDDGFDSGWAVQVDHSKANVYVHTDDKRKAPLIWTTEHGKGKFVVNNMGLYEKVMRGFYSATISLLYDVCAYPVINASVFYLDDFPSQIPSGNNEYIKRDYNTSIRDFYVNIWWPDMMNFADKYHMRYTGLAIQCYDDNVDGTLSGTADEGTFLNFGNMLMRQGGEIGYHGYNHQPLCLGNCDYKDLYDYKTWKSYGAMKTAFDELVDLCDRLFPDIPMQIYVPPSNLLSNEGRWFLLNEYPQIRTISGIYFEDDDLDFSCTQEYDVDANGIVDQPRAVSGCKLTPFMNLAVISELNFHFVNNHFTHPDDALDPDRGAEIGWERLKVHFDEYLSWIYGSAPQLRNFTGTETSAAVQRFIAVSPSKTMKESEMVLKIGNFYEDAQFLIRFNDKTPKDTKGGTLTQVTGNLYLLDADEEVVTITFKQEKK